MADEELVPKKNSKSVIWGWFGFAVSDVSQARIICKICRATVGSSGGNTTNLFNHLRRKHPKDYAESASVRAAQTPSRYHVTQTERFSFTGQSTKHEQSSKLWEKTSSEHLAVGGGPAGKVPSGNGNWDGAGGMDQITVVRIDDTHIAEDQSHVGGKGKDGATEYYEMEYSVPAEEEEEAEEEEDSVYVIEYSNPEEDGESYQFTMSVDRSLPAIKPMNKYPVVRNHTRAPVPVTSKPSVPPRPRHEVRQKNRPVAEEEEEVASNKRVLEYSDVMAMNSDSGKHLLCPLCPPPGRFFKRGAGLAVHLKQMHGIEGKKTFFCTSCQKSVRTQIDLDLHTKRHAHKRAVFTCPLCAAETENKPEVEKTGFSGSRRGLRIHLEKEHPGVIPHCSICNKHFKSVVSYLADQFRHIGVSPYYCAKCQIYEMTERGLRVHIRNHNIEKRKKQEVQPQASAGENQPQASAGENHLQALAVAAGADNSATDDSDF